MVTFPLADVSPLAGPRVPISCDDASKWTSSQTVAPAEGRNGGERDRGEGQEEAGNETQTVGMSEWRR